MRNTFGSRLLGCGARPQGGPALRLSRLRLAPAAARADIRQVRLDRARAGTPGPAARTASAQSLRHGPAANLAQTRRAPAAACSYGDLRFTRRAWPLSPAYVSPWRELAVLDAEFSVRLSGRARDKIGEFFHRSPAAMEAGPPRSYRKRRRRPAGRDLDSFKNAATGLAAVKAGTEVQYFAMRAFGNSLLDLLREYSLYSEQDFVFPLVSLAII